MNTEVENDNEPSNQVDPIENVLATKDLTGEIPEVPSNIMIMEGCPKNVPGEGQQRGDKTIKGSSKRPSSSSETPSSLLELSDSEEFHDAMDEAETEPEPNASKPPRFQVQFRIEALKYYLQACTRNATTRGEVDLNSYLNAYQEICKLLENFGTVVRNIIGKDIKNKISIMKKHQRGYNAAFYQTVDSMVTFEKVMQVHRKNPDENGSKTILNLHRSLHFVVQFLRILNKSKVEHGVGSLAKEAYFDTLAKFHPSGYKVIARAAFTNLGSKGQLISNFHDGSMPYSRLTEIIKEVVAAATEVHARCQAIFTRHNLLNLA